MRVPFLRAAVAPANEWVPLLDECYRASYFTNFGVLERQFAAECRDRYAAPGYDCVPVTNATAGLTAALLAVERPRGRPPRVVLPSFTFPATLHSVLQAGCVPVLCDADWDTWELDLNALERLLDREGAEIVVPVRSYGFVRSQEPLIRLGEAHGCAVVIDGAAAFGHPGRAGAVGSSLGEIEVVSLHATKSFPIGEGGLVFAPVGVAEELKRVINFGIASPDRFGDGGNMKLDEFRAAIGIATLPRIDALIAQRRELAAMYSAIFADGGWADMCGRDVGPTPWQCYPVRFPSPGIRAFVADRLLSVGIGTRRYYRPSIAGGYDGLMGPRFDPAATPVAERLQEVMLCLPIYPGLEDGDREFVADTLRSTLRAVEAGESA